MLESLKSQVRERYTADVVFESVNETPDEVKDALLAEEESAPMEVNPDAEDAPEDDPQVASLVENLPESEEDDTTEYSDEEMDSITEAFTRI
jgi:hypothetical protein